MKNHQKSTFLQNVKMEVEETNLNNLLFQVSLKAEKVAINAPFYSNQREAQGTENNRKFSTKRRHPRIAFKQVLLVMLALTFGMSIVYACEIVAMKGLNGYNITGNNNQYSGAQMFTYFKRLGYSPSEGSTEELNGFGITFYMNNSANTRFGEVVPPDGTEDRRFAHYEMNATQNPDIYNPTTNFLSIMGHTLQYSSMRTVLAHKRKGSSGALDIADPHPFVYKFNDRSYSFAHNGTLTQNHLSIMNQYMTSNLSYLNLYPELRTIYDAGAIRHPVTGEITSRLDSAVFYTFLLIHIHIKEMDILRGLHTALNSLPQQNTPNQNMHNFILTDGYDIYAYRNGEKSSEPGKYKILYFYYPTLNATIVSTANFNYNNASIVNPFNNALYTNELANRSLLYIPEHGGIVVFNNFVQANQQPITMKRSYKTGWNWIGFPVIPDQPISSKDYMINRFTRPTPHDDGNPLYITFVENKNGTGVYAPLIQEWIWHDIYNQNVNTNFAMKIKFDHGYLFNTQYYNNNHLNGILPQIEPYNETFTQGNQYWVTYNLTSGQSVKNALGAHFHKIDRVYAENWTYSAETIPDIPKSPGEPHDNPNSHRPLEFGKSYIIELKSSADPITNFKWTDSRNPTRIALNRPSEFFEYEDKMNYEAIDIISINNLPTEYVEIGVFADDICIGATKVDGFPVQILIYSEGYEGSPLTFKALDIQGNVAEIDPIVEINDAKTGERKKKVLIAGQIDYVVATLDNKKVNKIPSIITTYSNYPNPFNPSTSINFTLANNGNVTIDVYDIKGRLITKLINDNLSAGKHSVNWEGLDESNRSVASGVYLYRISTDSNHVTGKMVLLK